MTRLASIIGILVAGGMTAASAGILVDANPAEQPIEAFEDELETFEAMGDGMVLTLAVCEEDPHCVTAVSEHEFSRLTDQIEARIEALHEFIEVNGGGPEYARLLEQYERVRERYSEFVGEYERVASTIDRDALEGDWVDLLDFGIAEGPSVPSPNDRITLDRFVDLNYPLPIE